MPASDSQRLGAAAITAGGLLMAGLWLVFTNVHGPTSFNENGVVLGRSMHFWGMLLGGPPNLLVALGLLGLYRQLSEGAARLARIGYVLTLIGLVVPGVLDLVIGALGAPFFVPVLAVGLLLMAWGSWRSPGLPRPGVYLVLALGLLLAVAFAWALAPMDVSDSVGGYRLYGLLAHFAAGFGWVGLGLIFWQRARGQKAVPVA